MRGLRYAVLLLGLVAPLAVAAPVAPMPRAVAPAPAELYQPAPEAGEPALTGPAEAPWMVELKAKNVPAAKSLRWEVSVKNRDGDYVKAIGKVQTRTVLAEKAFFFAGPPGEYLVLCSYDSGKEFVDLQWTGRLTGGATPPGPNPPPKPPDPPGPVPPPQPVTSFRVLFIWESGKTLTAAQNSVINGVEVAKFLDARTTKTDGAVGWRLKDKDAPTDADTPTMNELWKQVQKSLKEKNSAVPCVAIEVNGTVEIIPPEPTPAAMVAKFKQYIGEK